MVENPYSIIILSEKTKKLKVHSGGMGALKGDNFRKTKQNKMILMMVMIIRIINMGRGLAALRNENKKIKK